MAPYEALYGRKCRTSLYWTELKENQIHEVDLVRETKEKVKVIRDCLKVASDRQKSYSNLKRKKIEYQVGDRVISDMYIAFHNPNSVKKMVKKMGERCYSPEGPTYCLHSVAPKDLYIVYLDSP
ncbi:casein kinase II subunit alpha, chloroplastic-like [Gossypium australe]|uniref:Casein kinase II subunit alpha, chloroplastic-like n=1 Tax=Gossypium australe TaxID=47621 RepID=A0A5B6UXI0_9ROSI|nr:casein kinase II subunit alpha, chloroplastic-like [Gossypium australe]